MESDYSYHDIYEQQDLVSEQLEGFKRSSWPATAFLQRPAPAPRLLAWFDRKLLAGVISIVLICLVSVSLDLGLHTEPLSTSAHLMSPASTSYDSIPILSSVLDVDLAAEVLLLEFRVQQRGAAVEAACSAPNAAQFEVAVGTAEPAGAPPAAVLPLCGRLASGKSPAAAGEGQRQQHQVYTVPIPMRQGNALASPWEELAADVQLTLRCAGAPCSARSTPGITWAARWTSDKMRMSLERHLPLHELLLMDTADMYTDMDEHSISYMEAVGLHTASPVAAFRVHMTRHQGIRVLQLLVAVSQLCFIIYCLLIGAGQVLWAFVVHRFLCMRRHGGARL